MIREPRSTQASGPHGSTHPPASFIQTPSLSPHLLFGVSTHQWVSRLSPLEVLQGSEVAASGMMAAMACPAVNPAQSLQRCSFGRRRMRVCTAGVRCRLSSTQDDVGAMVKSSSGPISVSSLLEVVSTDIDKMNNNLKSIVGAENPVLMSAAEQIFGAGGKRLRPAIVFLVSRATAQMANLKEITIKHQRLAEIIEMIHTASLIHDDVLDESAMRRGKETIHQLYGVRVAVLAGDFMFAQASWYLASLRNFEVIELISLVIREFATGELKQASSLFDCDITLEDYLLKSYHKTALLVASSARSAAIFSGVSSSICTEMFEYGKNLGLSFQVVDDILDFTQSAEQLGKPAGADLEKGNLTAPVIFALEKEPKLRSIISSDFREPGSLETAIELVHKSGGIERARDLAREKAELAIKNLRCLPESEYRSSLEGLVKYNLERIE